MIQKNSIKAWILAARPKTLSAAASPIIVACALAFHNGVFVWQPALICLVFALIAQITSNFANDYFDYKKGADNEERIGPKRAVTEGWIEPKTMRNVIFISLIIACAIGLLLIFYGGWKLIFVGMLIAVFALAYSSLAYHGLGDICVFVFFGIIPVGFTYYIQASEWTTAATICGAAVGFTIMNILIANNYRDRESDKKADKKTTIVLLGEKFGRYFYLLNGIFAVILCSYFLIEKSFIPAFLPLIYLFFHICTWRKITPETSGKEMITILHETARNVLIFSLLLSIGLILENKS
jgi:1,4-dihydroxy-2-naphthoate octaprenyltransferase